MPTPPDRPVHAGPGEGRDEPGAPDLPLASIPSVPDDPALEEPPAGGGALRHALVGAAFFALVVAAALLLARYMKMPTSAIAVAPPEEHAIAPAADPAAAGAPAAVEPPAPAGRPLAEVPPPAVREPEPPQPTLERELAERTARLAEVERALARERDARRSAEKKLDTALKAAETARAARPPRGEPDRKTRARLKELEATTAKLRKDLAAARRDGETAEARARTAEGRLAELSGKAESAEKRARNAESAITEDRARHEAALKGESEAVRKLVAQLEAARREAERERRGRLDAERKLRERETAAREVPAARAGEATRPRESAPSRGAVSTASATVEPQRKSTPPPRYPDVLRRAGIGGRVTLRLLVGDTGEVQDVEVVSTPDRRLGEVAANAARRWTYLPGRKDGIRAAMWITELVDFRS